MASVPRTAARLPDGPPATASNAASDSQIRDLSAARDSRRSGSSSAGVGVVAIASYTARSTAASWWAASRVVTRVC